MTVTVRNVSAPGDLTWIVLEGTIEGVPQVTQRRSIAVSALASGALTLAVEKAALEAAVTQAHANWVAVQQGLTKL